MANIRVFPCIFPVIAILPSETGSYLTAHTTIQSPQTARFRHDAEYRVSAGISGHSVPGFWSLRAFARLNDDFWRFVSASKNSVPGSRALSAKLDRTAPVIQTFEPP